MTNTLIHVGEVVYGQSVKIDLDFFHQQIETYKFDCPCVQASYNPDSNIIIAKFVGNERPRGLQPYHKIIQLDITYDNGSKDSYDLQLLIINDYDTK